MGSDCGGCLLASGFCWFGGTGALLGSGDQEMLLFQMPSLLLPKPLKP